MSGYRWKYFVIWRWCVIIIGKLRNQSGRTNWLTYQDIFRYHKQHGENPDPRKMWSCWINEGRKKIRYHCNGLWRPAGLWDVEVPTFPGQSARRRRWGFQPYRLAPLFPGRFLVLISARGWVDSRDILRLEGLRQMKIQWSHRKSNPRPSFW
jgi:hypothetical protein